MARCGSCFIVLQCLLIIPAIEGSRGSYVITNTGLVLVLFLTTLFRASNLGISLALFIAALTTPILYCLDKSRDFNSSNLFSLDSGRENILTILNAKENGIFCVTCAG